MEEIQSSTNSDTRISEAVPAPGEALLLLAPLVTPIIAYVIRGAVRLIIDKQKAKIEEQVDNREYLQQQNELLLRELLERTDKQELD